MQYKDWEPIYNKISNELNLHFEKDNKAAEVLNKLLQEKKLISIKTIEELIKGKNVIVFGSGPSLEVSYSKFKHIFDKSVLIAADGATSYLLEKGIFPDIIVTDLDGKIVDQISANLKKSIVIVHAHGDNIDNLVNFVPKFKGKIVGTTQIDPEPYKNLFNFGGFTDGDRAVFIADHFNAKKINLIGFDFIGKIGSYSFFKGEDKNLKLQKLNWCKNLIDLIKEDNQNIQEL